MKPIKFLALDIGEKRIGVAAADSATKLAYPLTTIVVDGNELMVLDDLIKQEQATQLVIGYPRNMRGEPTAQTEVVTRYAAHLEQLNVPIAWQDETLTSVAAEEYLQDSKKGYNKGDIDAHAAAIILTDYLEAHYA